MATGDVGRDEHGGTDRATSPAAGASHAANAVRQLFDPRRDDPMRFALHKGGADARADSTGAHVSNSTYAPSLSGTSAASIDLRTLGGGKQSESLLDDMDAGSTSAGSSNSIVRELKAAYTEILALETELHDEDTLAKDELADAKVDDQNGEAGNLSQRVQELRDDQYWVRLAQLHKR